MAKPTKVVFTGSCVLEADRITIVDTPHKLVFFFDIDQIRHATISGDVTHEVLLSSLQVGVAHVTSEEPFDSQSWVQVYEANGQRYLFHFNRISEQYVSVIYTAFEADAPTAS